MTFINRFLLAAALISGACLATADDFLVTHAWHLTFAGSSATGDSNPMVFDASGNFYFQYVSGGAIHLQKLSPAENLYFDVTVAGLPTTPQGYSALAISPKISGSQYVYVGWTTLDLSGNPVANVAKYDTTGAAQWSGPITFSNGLAGDYLLACAADSAGNVNLAMQDFTGSLTQFRNVQLDANGLINDQTTSQGVEPTASSIPIFDSASSSWLIAGDDNTTPGSAVWGKYKISDGTPVFNTSISTTATQQSETLHLNTLPGGRIAVIHDVMLKGTPMPQFSVNVYDSNGNALWQYPATGTTWGNATKVASAGVGDPVYVIANYPYGTTTYDSILSLSWDGSTLNWRRNVVPADDIYPVAGGFFLTYTDANGTLYIEHGEDSGILDWAHHYDGFQNKIAGFGMFQNAFYLVVGTNGPVLTVDRYITGVTLYSLAFDVPSVKWNKDANLTITLNAPAPAGGLKVGLTSFDPSVIFDPQNVSSMVVTIPEGQTTATFAVDPHKTDKNETVFFIAINQGVRCNASIDVTGHGLGTGGNGE